MNVRVAAPALCDLPLSEICGRQVVLRALTEADELSLAASAGDGRVARGTRSIPHPLPEGGAAAFIAAASNPGRSEDVWAIDAAPPAAPGLRGVISLKPLDRGQSQIGYWVAPAFWNSGIASQAVVALIAANPQGARTIFAEVFQDNPVSARILTQAGFDFIGDAEAVSVARGGATVPTWTYLRRMG